jgi:hypothetical protein
VEARSNGAWTLRPLGLGEVLDRAITLTIRNAPLFIIIAVVYALPQAVFAYYGAQDQAQFFGGFADAMRDAVEGKHVNVQSILRAQRQTTVFNGFTVLLYLWLLAGLPLYSMALIAAASLRYRGEPATPREAYSIALRRAPSLIGITLIYLAILLIGVFIIIVAGVSIVLGITLLAGFVRNTAITSIAIIVIAVVAVIVGLITALAIALGYVSVHIAWMTNVFEGSSLVRSVAKGFDRVFDRAILRRSIWTGITYSVLSAGYSFFVIVCVGLIGAATRSNVAAVAFSSLMQIGLAAFFAVFFMIYYYDVRVRREGLDLELAAKRLG